MDRFQNTLLKFINIKPEQNKRLHSQLPSLQVSRVNIGLSDVEEKPYVYQQQLFGLRNQSVRNKTPVPFFKPFYNIDLRQKLKTGQLLKKFQRLRKQDNLSFR